jgi:hypothetical protein
MVLLIVLPKSMVKFSAWMAFVKSQCKFRRDISKFLACISLHNLHNSDFLLIQVGPLILLD